MSELALTTQPGIQVTPTSLRVTNPNITFEELRYILDNAAKLGDSVRWWIGDLLLYADALKNEEAAPLGRPGRTVTVIKRALRPSMKPLRV